MLKDDHKSNTKKSKFNADRGKMDKQIHSPAWWDRYTSHVVALVESVADMAELGNIQLDIEEYHNSVVDPAERLPAVDKYSLGSTSEHLERKWVVAPLYTMAVVQNENGDDKASVRKREKID